MNIRNSKIMEAIRKNDIIDNSVFKTYEKRKLTNVIHKLSMTLLGILLMFMIMSEPVCAKDIVIVIDPGHGGENLGADYQGYIEKDMTITVAKAMQEELEKYEGIKVYLTRENDEDLTLKERVVFAKEKEADFLYCLHFNMSEEHTLFGAECWISAFGEQYSKGNSFAQIELELLEQTGLYSRGIKTRMNSKGTDYYGIIREATERNLPCVLIEHCHLDHKNDADFFDHNEKLKEFGKLDATAVAKYFQLKSEKLGVDYSHFEVPYVEIPSTVMKPDETEPDICMIDLVESNAENRQVTVEVSAADYDSGMLYYQCSYDEGEHYSEWIAWPDRNTDTFQTTIEVPAGITPKILVNVCNKYGLMKESNCLELEPFPIETEEMETDENKNADTMDAMSADVVNDTTVKDKSEYREITIELPDEQKQSDEDLKQTQKYKETHSLGYFTKVCVVLALLFLGMVISMIVIIGSNRSRR